MENTEKILLRTIATTSTHVEMDIKDENGNYKPYTIPDSIDEGFLKKKPMDIDTRPSTSLYVDLEEIDKMFKNNPYKDLYDHLKSLSK